MESEEDLAASLTYLNEMAPPALVKFSGKHLVNQLDQDLSSWRVSVYTETSDCPSSSVLNSSDSSDFKGISLDLQLCK